MNAVQVKVFATTILVCLLQLFYALPSEGSRILVFFPTPSPSHFKLGNALVKELLNRNHSVTFVSSFGSKVGRENLKDVVVTAFHSQTDEFENFILHVGKGSVISQFQYIRQFAKWFAEGTFKDKNVQNLLKSGENFDLVLIESFLSESYAGLAHHFDCPLIVYSSLGSSVWTNHLVANQGPPSYVPQILTDYSANMDFWTRIKNFVINIIMEVLYKGFHLPDQERTLHENFPNAPPLREIINERLAILLLNSHPSINHAKPSVPNMIEIGGYHVPKTKPLPKDLQDYLDNAKEGCILFSMGTNMKSTMLPLETRQAILKVLAQLPHKVLWKYEEDLPGVPSNVRISKWLPQNDILPHPNIKLFITHGGLLSTIETVYHAVPIVGIPVYGDQAMNMAGAVGLGIGKAVPLKELTYERLLHAVKEVLGNKIYTENVRYRSATFRDQPMHPMDVAMFWIEYVLRHKHANHLKTGAINLTWYQIKSFDVIIFLGSVFVGIIILSFFALKKVCRSSNSKNPTGSSKKNI